MGIGATATRGQLITFDDLPGTSAAVDSGYKGLTWNNFWYIDPAVYGQTGYANGMISTSHVAFNGFGADCSFSSAVAFTLTSLYVTGAWNDGMCVEIDGYREGSLIYSNSYLVDSTEPTFALLNYLDVDTVTFSTSGGVNHGYGSTGTQFALDNVLLNGTGLSTTSAVPEPSTYGVMAAAGLVGLVAVRRRRTKA